MAEHVVAFVCCVVVAATDGTSPRSRVPTFAESEFLADVDPLTFSPIFALKEINQWNDIRKYLMQWQSTRWIHLPFDIIIIVTNETGGWISTNTLKCISNEIYSLGMMIVIRWRWKLTMYKQSIWTKLEILKIIIWMEALGLSEMCLRWSKITTTSSNKIHKFINNHKRHATEANPNIECLLQGRTRNKAHLKLLLVLFNTTLLLVPVVALEVRELKAANGVTEAVGTAFSTRTVFSTDALLPPPCWWFPRTDLKWKNEFWFLKLHPEKLKKYKKTRH